MSDLFPANSNRLDPYKSYAFLVFLGGNIRPAAAVSGVGPVRGYTDVVEYREGDRAITLKSRGRTYYWLCDAGPSAGCPPRPAAVIRRNYYRAHAGNRPHSVIGQGERHGMAAAAAGLSPA
jgi:hypothetical protein